MERPTKRPRLSIFDQNQTGDELDTARYNNDMSLKTRFESIFAKYTQDFTGIGDEVDILTGELVVNNGHLESMENETDPGIDHLVGDFTSTGRSMLRAMTVNLNPDLPGPDDVLMSIEVIAENAALTDDLSTDESEDQLFETSRLSSASSTKSTTNSVGGDQFDGSIEPYNSDSDSLFGGEEEEQEPQRCGSVDSLFERDNQDGDQATFNIEDPAEPITNATNTMKDDEDIIARFGPHVGKEVLSLIGRRKEAHIEPAWRIPVQLDNASTQRSTPRVMSSVSMEDSPQGKYNVSLWKVPNLRKSSSKRKSSGRSTREESIDPLQDDFVSENESAQEFRMASELGDSDPDLAYEQEPIHEVLIQASANGDCPYCELHFGNKSGVMAHWDRWLKQMAKRPKEDDPHDLENIKRIRASARVRIRLPRLVVYDFRTMVELHEGAGMTFDEIAASKTLRTRKTGLKLQDIYNKHRTPPFQESSNDAVKKWTQAEEQALEAMCRNSLATMTTLRRGLKGRGELEIGNHLANIWLAQLGALSERAEAHVQSIPGLKNGCSSLPALHQTGGREALGDYEIKQEDSEDELFRET